MTQYDVGNMPKGLLKIALERFDLAQEWEQLRREEALDDLRFRAGEQWPDTVKVSRDLDKRPCLTINRLPQFIRYVTNDQRQNRPMITVSPVDDLADPDTAEVLQGIIRHIEYESNADVAYDTAFQAAVTHGFGFWRILTEYEDEKSFNQKISIKRIRNPFTVYFDPSTQEPDYSDAKWAFIVEDLSKDEYKELYGKTEISEMGDWQSIGDKYPEWVHKDGIRVAEYFYITEEDVEIALLSDGTVRTVDNLPDPLPENIMIVDQRMTKQSRVNWVKMTALEILEETVWLGKWIPIIPVLGDEIDLDGKLILEGIVRHSKDPQRMYNYWASAETETIALAPRAPFIGAEGQFEGKEDVWREANVRNFSYLEYKPKTLGGALVPPPQRNAVEPPVMAITNARMQSSEDLKATTGIYDPALGVQSNERSGKAILARQQQSSMANFHYIDNLSRAIRHCGRILIDLIPQIYDGPRIMRIIGEEGDVNRVPVNQRSGTDLVQGAEKVYDLTVGRYDVIVSAGPSYATKRQEAVDSMLALTQSFPELAQVAGDLMVKNMDWPGAKDIAARLKKLLPPEMLDENEKGGNIPPEVMQQMQQMQQMVEALTQQLNAAQDELEDKQAELDSKEKIEFAKMQVDLITKLAAIESKDAQAVLDKEINIVKENVANMQAQQPSPDDGAAAQAQAQMLDKLMERLTGLESKIGEGANRPPIQVVLPSQPAMRKTATAKPQADGSFVMEAVEEPIDDGQE